MSEQQTTEHTAVEQAGQVLAELESKRRLLVESRASDDAQRREIAFAALATNDKAAAQTLGKLAAAAARFDVSLREVDDAIVEGRDRLARARAAEALEVDRLRARELQAVIEQLREAGSVADDCLADLVEAGAALKTAFDRLAQLGVHSPRHEQLSALGARAILTSLMLTPWKRHFETLAPGQRQNFAHVIAGWCANLERDVSARLGNAVVTDERAA